MNYNKYKLLALTLLIIAAISSCRKSFFYPGINTDPTRVQPSQLTPSVLLTGAEVAIGYTIGGDVSRFAGIMDQQLYGAYRQAASYENYIYANSDFDGVWSNIYEPGLNNLAILRSLSDSKGYSYYSGVSRVLLAYEFGVATDMWGDIPFSSAFQGTKDLQPAYDKQQDIYPKLQTLLDSAIIYLSVSDGGSSTPGSDDFIYGGDPAKWTAFAYSLKARYFLHLSKKDPSTYADSVLAVLPKAISSSSDNAVVPFFNSETQANPWYEYNEQREDISFVYGKADTLWNNLNDPRASAYIDQSNDILTDLSAGISSPVPLITYTELMFMKAEALSAKSDAVNAKLAYNTAVTSAFADAGVTIPSDYLTTTAPLSSNTTDGRLSQIITQKYLALYLQPEAFNDTRRTGYPVLTPITGANLPQRFLYPNSELSFNVTNVPTGVTLFTKIWLYQ